MPFANQIRKFVPREYRPVGYLEMLAKRQTGNRVNSGPFRGMVYGDLAVGSAFIPKLIGIYERELWTAIETACAASPSLVIDIGAAEGYYAVGLALKLPRAHIVAFEADALGQEALRTTVALNQLQTRVEVHGQCEPQDLEMALRSAPDRTRPLVICDVEGYETVLLDQDTVPSLRRASILVELHEFVVPGIAEQLKARFMDSHEIQWIHEEGRELQDFPWRTAVTTLMPRRYLRWAVSEWRPERMSWLWMQPRSRENA